MKATDLLKSQHAEVKKLFGELEKTDDGSERRRILTTIAQKLHGHMVIEEEIFYPAVREESATKKSEEMIPEAYEEHHVVKLVLAEMPGLDPEDERFTAKMTVLKELIEHHVEEEEKELFKAAQKLGKERLEELGESMSARFSDVEAEDSELGAEDSPFAATSDDDTGGRRGRGE